MGTDLGERVTVWDCSNDCLGSNIAARTRPALQSAADAALDVLADTVRAVRDEPMQGTLTLPQAAQMVVAWSLVHGFAMLLLDNRLKQLIAKLPDSVDEMAFLPAILSAALPKT